MGEKLEQITAEVERFVALAKSKYTIKAAYLFGSCATGTNTVDSDVDIGLIVDDSLSANARFDLFSLGKDYDIDFDIIICPEKDYISEDPLVVHEMKTKGIKIA